MRRRICLTPVTGTLGIAPCVFQGDRPNAAASVKSLKGRRSGRSSVRRPECRVHRHPGHVRPSCGQRVDHSLRRLGDRGIPPGSRQHRKDEVEAEQDALPHGDQPPLAILSSALAICQSANVDHAQRIDASTRPRSKRSSSSGSAHPATYLPRRPRRRRSKVRARLCHASFLLLADMLASTNCTGSRDSMKRLTLTRPGGIECSTERSRAEAEVGEVGHGQLVPARTHDREASASRS